MSKSVFKKCSLYGAQDQDFVVCCLTKRYFSVDVFVKNRERIRFSLKVGINDLVFLQ